MAAMNASDLHLSTGARPAVRVDGELVFLGDRPLLSTDEVRAFVRGLAEGRAVRHLDDEHDTLFVHTGEDGTKLRVAVFADHAGTSAVIRRLTSTIAPLEGYGLPQQVLDACRLLRGLVLVAGARGSGKSTLLASMTDYANRLRAGHLLSIEDPIEIVHSSQRCLVRQRQVGEHTSSFFDALRAAKREDVDVIVASELADRSAIRLAIEMADAGCLVIAGSPSTTAAAALERLVSAVAPDVQQEIRQVLASLPTTVVGQVLCRGHGGGLVPAIEIVLDGTTVTSFAESLVALVRHRIVSPEEAWLRAPDRDQIATAFHSSGIPFPS
jgi:twitching motility protein PilT